MSTTPALAPPTQSLPDSPVPKKTYGLTKWQSNEIVAFDHSCDDSGPPSPPPLSHVSTPPIQLQLTTDHDSNEDSAVPLSGDPEDEYTLSGYGDISLNEVVIPPLPAPGFSPSPLQPRTSQSRLRLRVQRPPMPKRRVSYYISDAISLSGNLDLAHRWPGSPRPITKVPSQKSPWAQRPLPPNAARSDLEENKPVKGDASSLEKLLDNLLPNSPSIRLSPPGSPASQALDLSQETREQESGVQQGRKSLEVESGMKQSQPPAVSASPVPRQAADKPKPWRTRLPPRPPIPKWDMQTS